MPGPGGSHWLWGHKCEIFLNPAGSKFSEWFEKYGHVVRYKGAMAVSVRPHVPTF
uniref:Putative cytochrome p450 n=1 Tax=Moniliophthora roreri TaxID=221103 RepID=A0A0W0EZX9_MONRR